MLQVLSQKELEEKASLYHQDGILDIAIGLLALLVGLFLYGEGIQSVIPIYIVLWLPMVKSFKRLVTVPRMAYVAISQQPGQAEKKQITWIAMLTAVTVLFILGLIAFFNPDISTLIQMGGGIYGVVSLLMVFILAFAGWANNVYRFTAYTALALLLWFIGLWTGYSFPLLLLLGGIVLLCGIVVLWQFVHRYPVRREA